MNVLCTVPRSVAIEVRNAAISDRFKRNIIAEGHFLLIIAVFKMRHYFMTHKKEVK